MIQLEFSLSFFIQSKLIEPVLPQAAQLGMHLFCYITFTTQLEMHLLLRDLIKDTPLAKDSKKRYRRNQKKKKKAQRDSNLRPQEFCSAGV